jgi:hypothetical protein
VDDPAALLSVTVLDPACGSGHFLLAAARRIARRIARVRAGGVASPADYGHALRDVARSCLFGLDRNPMAVELTKVALWIETVEPGKPLGFLDANIRCGDALLGVFDFAALAQGIPDVAYKPLAGDDKEATKIAARINRDQREGAAQQELAFAQGTVQIAGAARAVAIMPEDDLASVEARARAYRAVHGERSWWATKTACDLYVAAFLAPKQFRAGALARAQTLDRIPTTLDVRTAFTGKHPDPQLVARAVELAGAARAFHWPLEFPAQMAAENGRRRGFDVVLGNPPWERIKLQEQEFFASREPEIAEAPNAAARGRLIAKLKDAEPGTRELALFEEFAAAKRAAEASSVFARVDGEAGGRFPLTGRGDVNTYALFAELFATLASKRGRAGMIVPTGIATDATTAPFFAMLVGKKRLARLIDFENSDAIFPAVHRSYKFSLLTIANDVQEASFAFFLTDPRQLAEPERRFTLLADDIARINPNTKTAPVFRSRADAELTERIYSRVPVLIDESRGTPGNPWGIAVHTRLWHMAEDSEWFRTFSDLTAAGYRRDGAEWAATVNSKRPYSAYVPLYEAKMISFYDHRFGSYAARGDNRGYRVLPETTIAQYTDPAFEPEPYYFVPKTEVENRLSGVWNRKWLIAFKDVTAATNERTAIFAFLPRVAVGHSAPLFFPQDEPRLATALVASLNSLVVDYCARSKVGGLHLTIGVLAQFPVLAPSFYTSSYVAFIVPRVLELTYTSHSMAPFARDLGYDGPPFLWDENRRAQLRAELDAWSARAYGLTRDELGGLAA